MNNCNCNKKCSCGGCCEPARYGCDFNIVPDPFDKSTLDITINGALKKVKMPATNETDTKISINPVQNTLNYSAERHTDTITGGQLGQLLELGDLKDTEVDETLAGNCYELVFRKYGNCGEGCTSSLNAWSNFNINSDGAKQDFIKYVRGANVYGCPQYLDVPTNVNQYWFAGWKTDGEHKQFGYYQPDVAQELPTDASGNTLVMAQNTTNKKPIVAPLRIDYQMMYGDCICSNIIPAAGYQVDPTGGHTICYYPRLKMASISIDFTVTSAKSAQVYFDEVIGTIQDTSLWPDGLTDLPTHWVWANNSDGSILPIALRVNAYGQVLLSGSVTARTATGKAAYITLGVDDIIAWSATN